MLISFPISFGHLTSIYHHSSIQRERERDRRNQTKNWRMTQNSTRKPMKDEETTCASHEAAHGGGEESGKHGGNRNRRRRRKQRQLLSEMLSELDSLTDDEEEEDEEERVEKPSSSKIIKELNNIKRQNTITHYLLTASILVTLAWQLSEISIIFKIRQGLNNPLKSIGGAIKGLFTSRSSQENDDNQDSSQIIPPTYLPGLKIPDLPHLDLPGFDTSSNDDD